MIEIKDQEIIPLLQEAKQDYVQKIIENDPATVEKAEKIEQALAVAMDIIYDYEQATNDMTRMMQKYCRSAKPVRRSGVWCCPACGKRVNYHHTHCHWCGKKMGWSK